MSNKESNGDELIVFKLRDMAESLSPGHYCLEYYTVKIVRAVDTFNLLEFISSTSKPDFNELELECSTLNLRPLPKCRRV
jgi:hypothetical protein